jgi:hypothetical protein
VKHGIEVCQALASIATTSYTEQLPMLCERSEAGNFMNPAGIDTSALLTMSGLIAAVWAFVPNTAK